MENNEDNKKKRKYIILIFLLFLFLSVTAISFSYNSHLEKNPKPVGEKPTKDDDLPVKEEEDTLEDIVIKKPVINILDDKNKVEIITSDIPNKEDTNKPSDEKEEIIEDVPSDGVDPSEYTVRDTNTKWVASTELEIFESVSQEYVMSGKIAPGITSNYYFTIRNNNNFSVIYSISFDETNDKNINMMYRLKKGNRYILGSKTEYISLKDKKINDIILDKNMMTNYTLEWKWVESSNDTNIGTNGANYRLGINVTAEEKV